MFINLSVIVSGCDLIRSVDRGCTLIVFVIDFSTHMRCELVSVPALYQVDYMWRANSAMASQAQGYSMMSSREATTLLLPRVIDSVIVCMS